MISIPYTSRDFEAIFEGVKTIMQTIEPRAEVEQDRANVESIIAQVIAGCVDTLSYNQDANILEAFPSTARDARAIFDLLSVVGYTPKTARCCHLYMTLWNPSFSGERVYAPYSSIIMDGKTFYCIDEFRVAMGITTEVEWFQGTLKAPDRRPLGQAGWNTENLVENYYPNMSINVMKNGLYRLPESDTKIDSRTLRIYTEDGKQLKYVENPYMTNITKSSFSIMPSVSDEGYSLKFSKDVAAGAVGENFFVFYIVSEGFDVGANITPDFGNLAVDNVVPSFSCNYDYELSHDIETADEARENIVYEFGWRDTPKAIITKPDAERAILQNFNMIAAVDVRDGDDYSKCDPSLFDIQIFCKVTEEFEQRMSMPVAQSIVNKIQTHLNRFKTLPLSYSIHIDNVELQDVENVTNLYYWYPKATIYLKQQVDAQEAAAELNMVSEKLFEVFCVRNMNFNQIPRTTDVLNAMLEASENILNIQLDTICFMDSSGDLVTPEEVTGVYSEEITFKDVDAEDKEITYFKCNTMNGQRHIRFHSVKIVDASNEVVAYDNGEGVLITQGYTLAEQGSIDYATGEVRFKLSDPMLEGVNLFISYRQEEPCFCEYINAFESIKIALESIKP